MDDMVKVAARIVVAVGMEYAKAQAHAPIAAWKGPGVPARRELAAHNQIELVLGIVGGVHVVFGSVAIAMKGFTHICAHTYVTREAAGVDGDSRAHIDTLADMILRRHACDAPVFKKRLLDGMAHSHDRASGNRTPGEMLVDSPDVEDTGHRR